MKEKNKWENVGYARGFRGNAPDPNSSCPSPIDRSEEVSYFSLYNQFSEMANFLGFVPIDM